METQVEWEAHFVKATAVRPDDVAVINGDEKTVFSTVYDAGWHTVTLVFTDRTSEKFGALELVWLKDVRQPEPESEPEPEPEYPDETNDSDITGEPAWNVSARQLQENYRNGMPAFPFSGDATTIESAGN